jgi:predicted metal-dependent peptidase
MNIDLSKIAKKLMLDEPFYGLFLLTLNKRENTNIPTACVSLQGINQSLEINPEYWNSLPELQRVGLLKHELLHIMFHHFLLDTTMYPDAKLRNIAADIEINQFIDEQNKSKEWLGLTSVPNLVLPEKAGTRVYYDMIKDKASTCPQVQNWLNGLGDDSDEFADGHGMWGDPNMDEATKKLIGKQLEHQVKEIAEHLDKKGSNFRGTLPGTLVEWIDSLFELPVPVTDWKSYFKRFISSSDKVVTKKSRNKYNKRFPGNPALKIKHKKNILVAIDTSGSVSSDNLVEFLGQLLHIHKTGHEVTVMECDAKITNIFKYKGDKEIAITGRGGTDFQPAIDYFNQHIQTYNTLVFFTDGYAPAPTPPKRPMLWVMTKDGETKTTKFPGKVVHMN